MHKIGLTGGICTGKSFILNIFKELGCYTIRADEIAKKIIFSPDSPVSQDIIREFGKDIYDEKSGLKKEEFTRILFEDVEKRNFVNHIVHPRVVSERDILYKDLEKVGVYQFFIYESALMVESGTYKDFKKIIVVYTSPEEQMKRLQERDGISDGDAEKRIKSQFPLSEKLKVANYIIDTSGSFENARAKALETFHLMEKDFNNT
ncbi:MAG: dephospho-CoA kinase [Candidatus Aminicenantes bacterium]|nr:dephospho-CoA kinase [Candidatus Aminicenantes bacterium]